MSKYKFPASLPRKMYWSDEVGGYVTCPACGAPLECEQHTYVLATRRSGDMDFHLVGNTAGHFCEECPVVVLDRDEFERFVTYVVQITGGIEYIVMGMVDLDAVPEDKRCLPFDDDTNPVPLVQFTSFGGETSSSRSGTKRPNSRKRKKRKVKS